MSRNIDTVQAIYEAFGRGDVPTILGHLDADIVWDHDTPNCGLPWYEPRNGVAEVPGFFEALMGDVVLTTFAPVNFLEGGDQVAVVVRYAMEIKATGRALPEDTEIHLWTFGADGKVVRFAHVVDRHAQWAAYNGVDA
jgi:ketosteroid isomerase-like protein